MTKSHIEFTFFTNEQNNKFDPTVIAGLVGLNEDIKIGIINHEIPGKNIYYKETFWEWRSKELETYVVDDLFDLMLGLFNPKIDILKEIRERYSLKTKLFIIIKIKRGKVPGLSFHRKILDFLNKLNCEIDIDLYVE